jgi:hypothetical protein
LEGSEGTAREARIRRAVERLEEAVADLAADTGALQEYGAEIAGIASDLASQSKRRGFLPFAHFTNTGIEEELPLRGDEIVAGSTDDELRLVSAAFLERGAAVQRAVARISLAAAHRGLPAGSGWATALLVGPSSLLTTHRAIPTAEFARSVRVHFESRLGADGDRPIDSYGLDPESSFHTSADLDYTLVRVRAKAQVDDAEGVTRVAAAGVRCGWLSLSSLGSFHARQRFRVIQHSSGRRREISLCGNEIQRLFHNVVRYSSAIEPPAPGSPVFDESWRLVAMQHAEGSPEGARWVCNQAIRADRIAEDLRSVFADRSEVLAELGL